MTDNVKEVARKGKRVLRARAKRMIEAEAPDHDQKNAALGLLSNSRVEEIKASIAKNRDTCNATEAAIDEVVASDKSEEEKIEEIRELVG